MACYHRGVTATADDLLARVAQLEAALAAALAARDQYQALYEQLREDYEKLKQGLLGQKAERVTQDDRQLTLALLATLLEQHGALELVPKERVRAHERQKPSGRKPLPDHLPRVDVELIPLEVQQGGLEHFRRIGEEVSEVLERRRASSVVVRVIRPKFVAKDAPRQGPVQVLIGDPADLPILRGRAGPGMLADTVVRRWQDHQPLHRSTASRASTRATASRWPGPPSVAGTRSWRAWPGRSSRPCTPRRSASPISARTRPGSSCRPRRNVGLGTSGS